MFKTFHFLKEKADGWGGPLWTIVPTIWQLSWYGFHSSGKNLCRSKNRDLLWKILWTKMRKSLGDWVRNISSWLRKKNSCEARIRDRSAWKLRLWDDRVNIWASSSIFYSLNGIEICLKLRSLRTFSVETFTCQLFALFVAKRYIQALLK